MHYRLLIPFLLCCSGVFAQKVNISIGPEMSVDKDLSFWGHLHHDASGHYVLLSESDGSDFKTRNKHAPMLQKYDQKFKFIFSKPLLVNQEDISFGSFFYAIDKFILCTQQYVARDKTLSFHATNVSLEGKLGKPQRLAQIQWNNKDDEPQKVDWVMSEDTTKLLVASYADNDDDDLRTQVTLLVHDDKLQRLWGKGFTLPYTQEQFLFKKWTLANDGKVYLLAKIYDDKDNKESVKEAGKRKPAYKLVVFRFDGDREQPTEIRMELGDKYVTDVTFQLSPQGDLSCAGFYSNDRRGVVQGVFFSRISGETGEAVMANLKAFTAEDLALFDTDKDQSGDEGLGREFEFNRIVIRDDGGVVVTAEQAYRIITRYRSGTFWYTRITYYNNEICVTSISPQGEIDWVRTIPKKQIMAETDMFSGYTMMVSGSKLYFLYNDDEDNLKKPLTAKAKRISSFADAVGTLVTVGADGKMSRELAFNVKEDTNKGLIVAQHCKQTGPDEMFFLTTRYQFLSRPKLSMGLLKVN